MDTPKQLQPNDDPADKGSAQEGRGGTQPLAAPRPRSGTTDSIDFRMLLDNSLDMVWVARIKNHRHRYDYCSPSTLVILGYSPSEIEQMGLEDIFTPESQALIAQDVEMNIAGGDTSVVVEAVRKDGRHIWLENKARPIRSDPDGTLHVAIYMRDVTERKQLQDRLAEMAFLDAMTGIKNRRAFDDALNKEWKRAIRTRLPLSLIMLDVDRFKLFNDTYGHQAGDACLRAVARKAQDSVRRSEDLVARYGGEELTVLLPETDTPGAEIVAWRICIAVRDLAIPHSGNDDRGMVTLSAGVATAIGQSDGLEEMPVALVRAADTALYQAKSLGRNQVATAVVRTAPGQKLRGRAAL